MISLLQNFFLAKTFTMSVVDFSKEGRIPEHLNQSVINMWTHMPIHPEQFYRTGFETIFFETNRNLALRCVLSSVVPAEKEIIVAGTGNLSAVTEAASFFDIPHIVFHSPVEELTLMETLVSVQINVSHIVLVMDGDDSDIDQYIRHLRPLLDVKKIELIIYCTSSVDKIHDRTNGAVDYFIGGWDELPDKSFAVARRNRLVQTEGNSRSSDFDLYASWQWRLKERGANILPMEM
ncbi:hypothetical protein DFO77_101173 [Marinilabilia salmonicolor]|jgi:hypothetical protein|uniref:Uncharacterized protein n=2 Tax=Marinilabilia salmonicolor TaxID=989 RepID=A0A2T0XQI1_9BACT|nr:hypothetical protein BY457_10314 [Marinilabilia salmonicolor]RCW39403.1 hypothetical protein DFO77_101173 [Marinilabilia salmonicolor]